MVDCVSACDLFAQLLQMLTTRNHHLQLKRQYKACVHTTCSEQTTLDFDDAYGSWILSSIIHSCYDRIEFCTEDLGKMM